MNADRDSLIAFLAFGREIDAEAFYGPWWPLFIEDGPHMAESPDACRALIRERLTLGGESTWGEIAVVPLGEWSEGDA